jgi:hypothetical protein
MIGIEIKKEAIALRLHGRSYSEISKMLGRNIPKSTFSTWFKGLQLPVDVQEKIKADSLKNLALARNVSLHNNAIKRREYLDKIINSNAHLADIIKNPDIAKVALAMLFLAEGSKRSGSIVFGNSDPYIIDMFLHLMRICYKVDEEKFRCTVQCRMDQDVHALEVFWSSITKIPLSKFLKAQVDRRSVGKPTKKENYKGVCRINYYSADVFNDLSQVPRIIY